MDPDQTAPLAYMQKVCLKSLHEDAADDKQTTFTDAGFLGAFRVKILKSVLLSVHRFRNCCLSKQCRPRSDAHHEDMPIYC